MAEKKSSIRYKSTDDSAAAYSFPDFSKALPGNKLGYCLCHTNPREVKCQVGIMAKIEKQKRKQEENIYLSQKRFFVKQIFEKGLNPYIGQKSSDSENETLGTESSPSGEYLFTVSAPNSPEPDTLPRVDDPRLSMLRSHTMTDLYEGRTMRGGPRGVGKLPPISEVSVETFNSGRTKNMINLIQGAPTIRELPPLQEAEVESISRPQTVDTREDLSLQRSYLFTPNIKKLSTLRQNPEKMFPKMNELIQKGTAVFSRPGTAETIPDRQKRTHKRMISQDEKHKKKEGVDYVQFMRKMTAYLPQHLKEEAQDQIREMTNSDAIYEKKKQLLQTNTERVKQSTQFDIRWQRLEDSLCPTIGLGGTWQKKFSSWTLNRESF